MGMCLVSQCTNSWDVQYAREFGAVICKKAVSIGFFLPFDRSIQGGTLITVVLSS